MLWQFGEFGYDISINQNGRTGIKPIKWEYLNEPFRQELFDIYAQMIHLKTKNVAFSKGQFEEINEGLVKKVSIKYQATEIYVFVNFGQKSIQIKANLKLRRWFDFFNETEVSFLNDSISLSAGEFRMFTSEKILKQKQ
jgi:pullulanase/glycogen debranching enzyme